MLERWIDMHDGRPDTDGAVVLLADLRAAQAEIARLTAERDARDRAKVAEGREEALRYVTIASLRDRSAEVLEHMHNGRLMAVDEARAILAMKDADSRPTRMAAGLIWIAASCFENLRTSASRKSAGPLPPSRASYLPTFDAGAIRVQSGRWNTAADRRGM